MFNLGTGELLVILLVAILLFGTQRLPKIAGSIGRAFREFGDTKRDLLKGVNDFKRDVTKSITESIEPEADDEEEAP